MAQPFHVSGAAAGPLLDTTRAGINLIRAIFESAPSIVDSTRAEHLLTRWRIASIVLPHLFEFLCGLRYYTRVFFTSAVTIKAGDELYTQVFNWLVERESRAHFIKEYTAQTLSDTRTKMPGHRGRGSHTPELESGEMGNIKFTPAFKATWFFYRWNLFAILRNDGRSARRDGPVDGLVGFDYFGPIPMTKSRDSVTITCLGWSIAPIQSLLEACREMAEAQKQTSVTILSSRDGHWMMSAVKPVRPLDTVYLEDDVKKTLISDLQKYLDPRRRQFYNENGIPYRRGYLLHGPPGCGKSSLSLALAGFFGLDLYILNFANVHEYELASLFAMLPPRCFVLLEDIDAVGFKRIEEEADVQQKVPKGLAGRVRQTCSISALLNVLDGIASQEGRVVIMTSNFPDQLDDALVRPGRIDVKVYMGHITRRGAEQIFMRMMKTGRLDMASTELSDDPEQPKLKSLASIIAQDGQEVDGHHTDEELQVFAQQFAERIPEATFTPAQIQGYLLRHLHSATTAVDKIAAWVVAEKQRAEDDARRKSERDKKARNRQAAAKAVTKAATTEPATKPATKPATELAANPTVGPEDVAEGSGPAGSSPVLVYSEKETQALLGDLAKGTLGTNGALDADEVTARLKNIAHPKDDSSG